MEPSEEESPADGTVLIVEDESLVAQDLKGLVEDLGFEVLGIEREGTEALETIRRKSPDLILMDIMLAGELDGIDVTRRLDEHPPPVVFLTAHTDRGTLDRAKETNPLGYLTKPINEADLRTTLEVALERKETLKELHRTKSRYRTLVEANPDVVIRLDPSGTITFVSSSIEHLGYGPEELVGEHFREIVHPEDYRKAGREEVLPDLRGEETGDEDAPDLLDERRTGERATRNLEVRIVPAEGVELSEEFDRDYPVFEVNSSGLYNVEANEDDRVLQGSILVIRDVTERKEAEDELELKERAMSSATEGITIARKAEDSDPLIYVNEGFVRMTGYDPEDVLGDDCRLLQGEGTREESRRSIREPLDNDEPVKTEILNYRKDGEPFWNELSITPIENGNGEVTHYVGIQKDITERKEREQELMLRERALNTTQEGIIIAEAGDGEDDPITYANDGFLEISGYDREEILGRDCRFLQGPETDEVKVRRIGEALGNEESVTEEILNYRKDGEPFWNRLSISPVRDEDGNVTHFIGIQQDITEYREQEKELRQSEKLAAIGEMAAGLMHEINNPNAFIQGNIEFIRKGWNRLSGYLEEISFDEDMEYIIGELDDTIEAVHGGTERIENIVNKVKLFARKKSNPRDHRVFNPIPEVRRALRMVDPEEGSSHATLEEELEVPDREPPQISGDPSEIKQLVTNLVENALDAVRGGEQPRVRVTTRSTDDTFVLEISDNGPGIPEDELQKIFDPFYTTKETGKGTGLGLSIVKGIVDRSGGDIRVESEEDAGTTFRISFPRRDGSDH